MQEVKPYHVKNKIRIVTSASLFDGHDAAINIMRRIMQATGAEIIHLGHNRSVQEIVNTAIQEDVQGIAITSYQGGHIEFFKYMYDLLKDRGAGHIKIFGGGGGTILPSEIEELQAYGIARLYSPDDGRHMGLQGMINDVLKNCDFPLGQNINGEVKKLDKTNHGAIARLISAAENYPEENKIWLAELKAAKKSPISQSLNHPITHHPSPTTHHPSPIIGITGTGGAGKSSLVDELVRRFLRNFDDKYIAIVSVDPSKRKTGGALLGDRIRMNAVNNDRVYMRSLATRQSNLALSQHVQSAVDILRGAHFDLIILETSGIGQSDTEIVDHSDVSLYVMTPEYGAATQLEKIDMLDFADIIAINKFDKRGGLDALRDVKKQYQRNHNLWDSPTDTMPVVGTIASQFNDAGMNQLYKKLMQVVVEKTGVEFTKPPLAASLKLAASSSSAEKQYIIPPNRTRYLSEISETCRTYDKWVEKQSTIARELFSIKNTLQSVDNQNFINKTEITEGLKKIYADIELSLDGQCKKILDTWASKKSAYEQDEFIYKVRGKDVKVSAYHKTLSGSKIPRVILPKFKDWGEILKWVLSENVPGEFPYAAGVFPFKREGEDPTRMFAGEGNPERTNRRFHYVSKGLPAKRLSTAFDSVTLYGEDPDYRPDIYGKVGNSGVSVCCLDDAKKLYSGFDLTNPKTSVSMTINGPAATITAFFMNAAIDQECEKYIIENNLKHLIEKKRAEIYAIDGVTSSHGQVRHPTSPTPSVQRRNSRWEQWFRLNALRFVRRPNIRT